MVAAWQPTQPAARTAARNNGHVLTATADDDLEAGSRHGDDMRLVPTALVGDDMVTTNEPSQPEYAWPPRHVVIVAGRVPPGPGRAGSRRAGLAPTPGSFQVIRRCLRRNHPMTRAQV